MYPLYNTGGINQPSRFQIAVAFSILTQNVTDFPMRTITVEILKGQNSHSNVLYFQFHALPSGHSPLEVNPKLYIC